MKLGMTNYLLGHTPQFKPRRCVCSTTFRTTYLVDIKKQQTYLALKAEKVFISHKSKN